MKTSNIFLELGRSKSYLAFLERDVSTYIRYPHAKKEYRYDDPEEVVRAGRLARHIDFIVQFPSSRVGRR